MNIWSRLHQIKKDDAASRGIIAGRWYSPNFTYNEESEHQRMITEDDKRSKELTNVLYSVLNR